MTVGVLVLGVAPMAVARPVLAAARAVPVLGLRQLPEPPREPGPAH